MKHHIISYSGGLASFGTACKVVKEIGTKNVTLLFADTLIEDEDLYRFLIESASKLNDVSISETLGEASINIPPVSEIESRKKHLFWLSSIAEEEIPRLVWIQDGRTPWDVFRDVKYIGNSRTAPCSKILKTEICRRWVEGNYSPDTAKLCLGLLWDEQERLPRAQKNWEPWEVTAPLCEEEIWTSKDIKDSLNGLDIRQPRLYKMGFPHNNCGGFCVRGGQRQFQELYHWMPSRYFYHEREMEKTTSLCRKTKPFLKKTKNGQTYYLSLKEFRAMMDEAPEQDFGNAMGGCACFVDD